MYVLCWASCAETITANISNALPLFKKMFLIAKEKPHATS